MNLRRKVGPFPLWLVLGVGVVMSIYLYRRWQGQHVQQGDLTPQFGLQPIASPGSVTPAPIASVPTMSADIVNTPSSNGVGSSSLQGSTTFKVPTLAFGGGSAGASGATTGTGGWEVSSVYPNPSGYSADQVAAAAARYSQGRSYGGQPYVPLHTQQEGHIETRGGVPGVYIKYQTGTQTTTEWTPLG